MSSIIHTHTPNTQGGFRGNASQLRPPSSKFQCREFVLDDEDYGQVVAFECTFHGCVESSTKMESSMDTKSLPQQQQQQQQTTLTFVCREPSCGVLVGEETAACKSEEDEQPMDPNFFDAGYTAAGKTGFQVWPGSRIVVEAMLLPQLSDVPQLQQFWQQRLQPPTNTITKPLRVLELGAGVGVVGTCLAQAGAHVLLTDLPTLVEESLLPNLQRNSTQTITVGEWKEGEGSTISPLMWMMDDEERNKATTQPLLEDNDSTASSLSHNLFQIGHGWAAANPLDWSKPVEGQLTPLQCQSIDVIVASDCVWLVSMLEGLLTTVETIFQHHHHQEHQQRQSDDNPNSPRLLLSFQRRDTASSDNSGEDSMFTTVDRVLAELHAKHWKVDCLAWHPVTYVDPETGEKDDSKEVFLFDVRPSFLSQSS